jgi:hypothetical protein
MAHDHDHSTREREVIVTNGGDGHGDRSVSSMLMAVVGIIVVLLVGWFAIQAISGSDTGDGGLDVPAEMDVDIDDGAGGGGEG